MAAQDVFGLVGSVVGGSYEVQAAVASGPFSVVYRAHHSGFRAPVALECLRLPAGLGGAQREQFLERFRAEVEAFPNWWFVQYYLGKCNLKLEKYDQALIEYNKAKGQRIHQQRFNPGDIAVKGVKSRGNRMTTKSIKYIDVEPGRWWDKTDEADAPDGVLL